MKAKLFDLKIIIVVSFIFSRTVWGQFEPTAEQLFPAPGNVLQLPSMPSNGLESRFPKPQAIVIDSILAQRLQTVLDSVRMAQNLTGLSAAVSDSAGNVWLGTSGYSVPANSDTIQPEMIFCIGSVTKTFIAALTMQLIEQGQLTLEDSLYHWIPAHPYIDSTVTIRQLLNHTSGIDDFLNTSNAWVIAMISDPDSIWQPWDAITTFLGPPAFPKGTQWGYSNTNYLLLGMIIEQITQAEVAGELRNRFYLPLGLDSTFLAVDDSLAAPRAHNWHDWYGTGQLIDLYSFSLNAMYSLAWTAGSMFATAENLIHWCDALYRGQVLSPSSLNQMVTVEPPSTFYGLGTVVVPVLGRQVWGHDGSYFGFLTIMLYSPQDKVSVVVCLNQNPGAIDWVFVELFRAIINHVPTAIEDYIASQLPGEFELYQNYPNPFNPATTIAFSVERREKVKLEIFDALGHRVRTLIDQPMQPGRFKAEWDGRNASGQQVASGIYFYRLHAGDFVQSRKMILLR